MKSVLKKIVIFIIIMILSFICSYFGWHITVDEVWNYGFAYNIAQGIVPYRDFNMIILPLYPMLLSFFISIFGHHLYIMHIFHAITVAIMILCMWKRIGNKVSLLVPIILIYSFPGYNSLSLFLMVILISICDKKLKSLDFILGILIGLMFLTKQTVGFCLLIPFLFYSKNRVKGLVSFFIPILVCGIYLLVNGAFYNFIDYCFLGMFDFTADNRILFFLPVEILIIIFLIYKLIKGKFQDKHLFYCLMYQVIVFPIFDFYHFVLVVILLGYLVLLKKNIDCYKIKYYFIMVLFGSVFFVLMLNDFYNGYHLYKDKNSYLYGKYVNQIGEDSIREIQEYIDDKLDEYAHFYLFTCLSYQIKLNMGLTLDKFDLINNGNMGYNGVIEYIDDIEKECSSNNCLFILYKYEFYDNSDSQTNRDIVDYVQTNYMKIEDYGDFYIYSNDRV